MSTQPAAIQVCTSDDGACIKIQGRADCTRSVDFKNLVTSLYDEGYRHFELDLTACVIMDSTFLGVLCGFAEKLDTRSGSSPTCHMILFNPNTRIMELLEDLGVAQLFRLETGDPPDRPHCVTAPASPEQPTREDLRSTSLEAHQTLMALNPDNIPKFKDLTEFLAVDLKRLRSKE